MSSYICSAKHFNSVASGLIKLISKGDFYLPYELKSEFENIYNKNNDWQNEINFIVNTLREINVLAVSLQYKHHYEGVLDAEIESQMIIVKEKTSIVNLTPIALFKSLNCLGYQIEIEHIKEIRNLTDAEEKALLFLKIISNSIACYVVENTSEYDKSNWGIN